MEQVIAKLLTIVLTVLIMYYISKWTNYLIDIGNPLKKRKNLKNFLEVVLPLMFCEDKIMISVFYEEGFDYYNVKMLNTKENQKEILGERLKYEVVRIYEYTSGIEIVLKAGPGYGR